MSANTDVRDRIVRSAWDCFTSYGISKTTIADIASGANVSSRSIYNYFSGKDEVLEAVADLAIRRVAQDVRKAGAKSADLPDRFAQAIANAASLSYRTAYIFGHGNDLRAFIVAADKAGTLHRQLAAIWQDFLENGQSSGVLTDRLSVDDMVQWITCCHSALHLFQQSDAVNSGRIFDFVRNFVVPPMLSGAGQAMPDRKPWTKSEALVNILKHPYKTSELKLLQAAKEIMADEWPARNFNVSEIASRAKIGRATTYRFFSGKENFYQSLLDYSLIESYARALEYALETNPGCEDIIVTILQTLARHARKSPIVWDGITDMYNGPDGPGLRKVGFSFWHELLACLGFSRSPLLADMALWLNHAQRIVLVYAAAENPDEDQTDQFIRTFVVPPLSLEMARIARS